MLFIKENSIFFMETTEDVHFDNANRVYSKFLFENEVLGTK